MYPVRLGFKTAKKRIKKLHKNGHYPESILVTFATAEKMIRRTLRKLLVNQNYSIKDAEEKVFQLRTIKKLKKEWKINEPNNKGLPEIIGNQDWQLMMDVKDIRNDFIHGNSVYDRIETKEKAIQMISLLENMNKIFLDNYGFSGWKKIKR